MRKIVLSLVVLCVSLGAAPAMPGHVAVNPDGLKWGDAPPVLPKGAKMAVLAGDPSKEGVFVVRLRAPNGYKISPHWHPTREHVTVISGKFHIGMGKTFDTKKAESLGPGGFAYMDAKMEHYAWMEGDTEIQAEGMGPFAITYVNPADDPSPKPTAKK